MLLISSAPGSNEKGFRQTQQENIPAIKAMDVEQCIVPVGHISTLCKALSYVCGRVRHFLITKALLWQGLACVKCVEKFRTELQGPGQVTMQV